MPYFNLEKKSGGTIISVGWPGQWSAGFKRDNSGNITVSAGQESLRTILYPGEEIRTPRMTMLFWKSDIAESRNLWRRWMNECILPHPGGKPMEPHLAGVSGNLFPGLILNEKDELLFIKRFEEEKLSLDFWWMDAGWYPNKGDWTSVGTWEPDPKTFPHGLKSISDNLHASGKKLLVWFEPERVTPGSKLFNEHPEWLISCKPEQQLLNLGIPEARKWLTEYMIAFIGAQGIDYYRQDFNMDPLPYWRSNDTPERTGITENHYITGYLAYWDSLSAHFPDMFIDSCASGGHRNDLETMDRAVPILRSDYLFEYIGQQSMTYGFSMWFPYWGNGFIDFDPYIFRSVMGPHISIGSDIRKKDLDWALLRELVSQWRSIEDLYMDDFYPLSPYTLKREDWIAWQYNSPEKGKGFVQAFRRDNSPEEKKVYRLFSLEPESKYTVKDMDKTAAVTMTGRQLMDNGIEIVLKTRPSAALIKYEKVK